MRPKLGNSGMTRQTIFFFVFFFFEGWSWFKFNNMRLVLAMALKFYSCVEKRVKTKRQKNLRANSYFPLRGLFAPQSLMELTPKVQIVSVRGRVVTLMHFFTN